MSFSFIHIADIHLGRPFSDLSDFGDEMDICINATKKSFERIVSLAIEKQVNFVLIAGDSFDDDEHDLSTKLLFIRNLKKLADNGIKSYVICGNHDPVEMYKKYESYFKFDKKYENFINITGVTTDNFVADFEPIEGVKIHSVSFLTEESNNQTKYLSQPDSKCFNIGLLHCDLDKTSSKYSPVTREDLRNLGYDYYALGHIHIPEIKENNIVYAGTHQGRSKKETDEHGCYYISVNDQNDIKKEFIPTDYVRFYNLNIDCSDCENMNEIFIKISDKISDKNNEYFYEINLSGITKAYEELNKSENILSDFLENYDGNIYKITNLTTPYIDDNLIIEDEGVLGILANCFGENSEINISEIYDNIANLHENIYKKLGLDSDSKEFFISALREDKNNIIQNTKNELKMVCKEIYNLENANDKI